MDLSRFSRSEMLIGGESVEKLSRCHVAVFGLGGVGSYTAEALVRAGVGELTVIDNDKVAITNINRQLYALSSTVGMKKTQVAAARIKDINPECKVNIIDEFYLEENSADFFENRYDYMADAVDTVQAKLSLAIESQRRGIPLISCMGTGNKLDPTLFRVSDITKTSVCPLCRVMRRELKVRGISHLKVVWSPEQPITTSASVIIAQLLYLEGQDPEKDISFYINSPGGSITDGMAIHDTMKYIKCDVSTICVGMAASMGAFLLASGTKGKRFALPNSEILIHQPLISGGQGGGLSGQASDIQIHANHLVQIKKKMNRMLSEYTGQPLEVVEKDTDRDNYLTAEEAKAYGLIDEIIVKH